MNLAFLRPSIYNEVWKNSMTIRRISSVGDKLAQGEVHISTRIH